MYKRDIYARLGAMKLDFGDGGRPADALCAEVSEGVFERRFAKITVRLDY